MRRYDRKSHTSGRKTRQSLKLACQILKLEWFFEDFRGICCLVCITTRHEFYYRAPGRFSPERPGGAMSHFLHVTLTSEVMLEELDGQRSLGLRSSHSVSELFRGHIERFCNNYSRHSSDFSSAVEIQMRETRKSQIRQKSRSRLKIGPKSRSEILYALPRMSRDP